MDREVSIPGHQEEFLFIRSVPFTCNLGASKRACDFFLGLQTCRQASRLRNKRQSQAEQLGGDIVCMGGHQRAYSLLYRPIVHLGLTGRGSLEKWSCGGGSCPARCYMNACHVTGGFASATSASKLHDFHSSLILLSYPSRVFAIHHVCHCESLVCLTCFIPWLRDSC